MPLPTTSTFRMSNVSFFPWPSLVAAASFMALSMMASGCGAENASVSKTALDTEADVEESTKQEKDIKTRLVARSRKMQVMSAAPSERVSRRRVAKPRKNHALNVGLGGLASRTTSHGLFGAATGNIGQGKGRLAETPQVLLEKGGTFKKNDVNSFVETKEDALSTFAIDVDTGSYTFGRGYLERGQRPPESSVRVEEWVNAFQYDYQPPVVENENSDVKAEQPFSVHLAAAPSPFAKDRMLVRVGIKGKEISKEERKAVHLVFLVDTSGSMGRQDKLPLAKKSLHILIDELRDDDTISIVTYAGSSEEILAATSVAQKSKIHAAINRLSTNGGTYMESGMKLAYRTATNELSSKRMSRVIVISDGDANIGNVGHAAMLKSVRGYVSEGVTLSTLGFGRGNYNDYLMEQLADAGNGNYSYVDSEAAAKKLFTDGLVGMLQVIAKDVKIQMKMNAKVIKSYRLIGYENRAVADKDFRNDQKDAGEIGAGHAVTALYELVMHKGQSLSKDAFSLFIRHKKPRGQKAVENVYTLNEKNIQSEFSELDLDTRWAVTMALSAEILRGSKYAATFSLKDALHKAKEAARGPFQDERLAFVALLSKSTLKN